MEILWKLNPWWENKDWENKDKHLKEFSIMQIKWRPFWLNNLSLKPFSLNFVIGIRQVGKTTGIKLLIKELLQKGLDPFQILYLDLELFTDLKELREVFLYYNELRKKGKTSYIFLDEVTRLKDWNKIVKGFIDLGEFNKDVLTVTGSSTVNLLKHAESFVGRRGKGENIFVHPLSFKEFFKVKNYNLKKETDIQKAFEEYTELGGFPKSINQLTFGEDIIKSFEIEISENELSSEIAKQILNSLFEMAPSAVSFNAIANKIGKSNKTVESYIETFQDLFIAKIVYWKERKVNFRKEKKIFLRDPLLIKAFAIWCNKEVRKDFLYEWIVQEHLFRKFREIYYFKNKYEIDCLAGNLKIEVKAGKPHRKYPKDVKIIEEKDLAKFLLSL